MAPRTQILLLLAIPLVLVVGLVLTSQRLPSSEVGRAYVQRVTLPSASDDLDLPSVSGDEALPLVVIDAGHGGHDPGATGQGLVEKSLVLSLARALKQELEEEGGVRVALTRDDDRYLLHAERFEIARRLNADLFLSIHADSAGDASEVEGASIYTLSNEASSDAAARFAERENASDRLNGVNLSDQSDTVSTILVELSQRRTQEQSAEFARLIRREGEGVLRFHPQAIRSAALKVLRAPDVPSVLFESGFITNAAEAERLGSAEGREQFAQIMARAIRIYFARQQ
ncbi:N-acetylmuramoyl-L-alanine amidase [Qipengyuania sp. XHP0211]|uniref:N-acetylmuramoyl-L-alanine amidase family protein n=1 Tax=Qipengyuania sp. XHP0211 TaxID=3038079 RepID=UPI00241DD3CF|nr:N-acetylmuramoyl-L-alanine amidase [Qipengyuania sp. XHP0211]MDG5751154.1 N-acetylmuramoyl-L-alanine amidase [Qipengyuania sp. XHP0211]